ncbi:MAG: hypothetical protein K2M34_01240 [Alphaproteobacteria bacterium]|nr:hypothetical protein [Alphaproteobacteria bacterium]
MNKYLIIFLICVPTCVVAVPNKPYAIIHGIVQQSSDNNIVAYGTHNDALIQTPTTPALRAIYAGAHDSDFWSRYTVLQMGGMDNLTDNCFINFQYDFYTEYRLFCGSISDYQKDHKTVSVRKPITTPQSETD